MREQAEVYDVLATLARGASSYLCIGVQEGRCLERVVESNPRLERLVLCDTWGPHHGGTNRGSHDHIERMLDELKFSGAVEYLDGPSGELIPGVSVPCDLSFVDGAHDEASAFTDLCNVWPLTAKTMVVHDVFMPSVQSAFERFLATLAELPTVTTFMQGTGTAVVQRA